MPENEIEGGILGWTPLSIIQDTKFKYVYNQPIYGIVLNCIYFLILGFQNNWVVENLLDDVTDEVEYK